MKQSPGEKKISRCWFRVAVTATLSMLAKAVVVDLVRDGKGATVECTQAGFDQGPYIRDPLGPPEVGFRNFLPYL